MTAPFFPNVDQILDLIIGELPDGVYAKDRADDANPDNRSFSSSELRAHAQVFANLYENLQNVYADKFVSTITPAGLSRWEVELFSTPQDPTQSFALRQANLLAQLRAIGGISYPAIFAIVQGVLAPFGLNFAILQWNGCGNHPPIGGAWILDFSELDVETYLASADPLLGAGRGIGIVPLDCSLNYAAAGITALQLAAIQETAYTYEVQIFGNANAATLALLDLRLTQKEPARSTHVITNNAPMPGWISPDALDGGPFLADTLLDVVDFGLFTSPPATYDIYDFGSFV